MRKKYINSLNQIKYSVLFTFFLGGKHVIDPQTLMKWYADSQRQNLTLNTKSNIMERSGFMAINKCFRVAEPQS